MRELVNLDRTAEKLGLSPFCPADELIIQLNSNDIRTKFIQAESERRSHVISN